MKPDYIAAPSLEWVDPSELRRAREEKNRLDSRIETSSNEFKLIVGLSMFYPITEEYVRMQYDFIFY